MRHYRGPCQRESRPPASLDAALPQTRRAHVFACFLQIERIVTQEVIKEIPTERVVIREVPVYVDKVWIRSHQPLGASLPQLAECSRFILRRVPVGPELNRLVFRLSRGLSSRRLR
eukprot:103219-Rhodomonas_salina.1